MKRDSLWFKIRYWILERIGKREEIYQYFGESDFDMERGWIVGKIWFSYDNPQSFWEELKMIFGQNRFKDWRSY